MQRITTAGIAHPYLLSVPAKYQPAQPAPLVLLFSGYGSDAHSFVTLTKLPAIGAAHGVVVATPEGPNNTWQLSGSGTDAAFVDQMVATLEKTLWHRSQPRLRLGVLARRGVHDPLRV